MRTRQTTTRVALAGLLGAGLLLAPATAQDRQTQADGQSAIAQDRQNPTTQRATRQDQAAQQNQAGQQDQTSWITSATDWEDWATGDVKEYYGEMRQARRELATGEISREEYQEEVIQARNLLGPDDDHGSTYGYANNYGYDYGYGYDDYGYYNNYGVYNTGYGIDYGEDYGVYENGTAFDDEPYEGYDDYGYYDTDNEWYSDDAGWDGWWGD